MQKRVFLLDDDHDEHEIFESALKRIDEKIEFAASSSWQDAASRLRNFIPNFIFVDLNMPRTDGLTCITEIRKIKILEDTPIYIYSTGITESVGKKAISIGANNYMVKPASFIDLCKMLKKILE